jgi:polyhydroxyalkanoate synthesis regulator phasin
MTNATNKLKAINVTAATQSSVDLVLGSIAALDKVLDKWVEIEGKAGKIQAEYATQMVDTFGKEWWNAKGEIGKAVKAAHERFKDRMGKLDKSRANIDQMWKRIKELCGYVTKAKAQSSATATGGDASIIDAKTIAELKTIYNQSTNATEDEAPLSYKVKAEFEEILDMLGVEI